jgi:hypothetical protein
MSRRQKSLPIRDAFLIFGLKDQFCGKTAHIRSEIVLSTIFFYFKKNTGNLVIISKKFLIYWC